MFEQPAGKEEKDRSRAIMVLSGVAVIVVVALIVLVTKSVKTSAPIAMEHAGSPEFDDYSRSLTIENIQKTTGERLNTRFGRIRCSVINAGDRIIVGLQIRAYVVEFNNEALKEKVSREKVVKEKFLNVVPDIRDTLPPDRKLDLDIYLEPIPDLETLQYPEMRVEVVGIKLK